MPIIKARDVAYVRFHAPDLTVMHDFLADFGLVEAKRTETHLWMRGSGATPFVHVTEIGAPGFVGFGIEAASIEDLQCLAAAEGVEVEPLNEPGGGMVVRLVDPDGNKVEVVAGQTAQAHGGKIAQNWNNADRKERANDLRRVKPGPADVVRLGHVVFFTDDLTRSWEWYQERFGLIISDDVRNDEGKSIALFIRCDRGAEAVDHHTLNIGTVPGVPAMFHHAAFEVRDLDDLMAGHEVLKERGRDHSWGIGRHILGSQIFDYWRDPWGHQIEHWTDGDLISAEVETNVTDLATMVGHQWGPGIPADFVA